MSEFTIREGLPDDAAAIYGIHASNDAADQWADVAECREHLRWRARHGGRSIVAELDGELMGEMTLWWGSDIPEFGRSVDVSTLYVHHARHDIGVGRRLIEVAVATAIEHGCGSVTVWSDPDAEAFYRRCGFEQACGSDRSISTCQRPRRAAARMSRWSMSRVGACRPAI